MVIAWRGWWLGVGLALMVGCQTGLLQPAPAPEQEPVVMDLRGDSEQVRTNVLEQIPQGTSVQTAKETLEQNGFKCAYLRTKDEGVYLYGELTDAARQEVDHPFSLLLPYTPEGISDVQISSVPIGP